MTNPSQHAATIRTSSDPREFLVYGQVAEEVEACVRSGRRPDIDAIVTRFPGYERQIRELVPALVTLDQLGQPPAELGRRAQHDRSTDSASSAADPNGTPRVGSVAGQLGDFRIVRELGRGGMGIVYEAEQISLGRRVALKVLPFAAVVDPRQLERFKNEAMAAARLDHQNIVHVHFVGCDRGVHFYAMQFIEGQTLGEVIRDLRAQEEPVKQQPQTVNRQTASLSGIHDDPRFPTTVAALSTERYTSPREFFRTIARLGIQAAEALDHAHQLGIIHRDIKPSNLLLDSRRNLWITDFGLARVGTEANLTLTGDLIGTLRYMSPEQALAKRVVVDHRTDIYSLGVTLYELLTLRPVFSGHDRHEILRQIAFDEPEPPRKLNPSLPKELETIVLKAISKNPSERYATAQEFADDLRRHLDDKTILARRPGMLRRIVKWSMRHKVIVGSTVAATLAAAFVLAITAGWFLSDRQWRRHETDRELNRALNEAQLLLSTGNWTSVKNPLSRADGLLLAGHSSDALRQRVRQLHREIDTISRLRQIREDDLAMLDGLHDYATLDQQYESVFANYRMVGFDADESGNRMNGANGPIRQELAAALDHWALVRRRASGIIAVPILALARAIDPDPLRTRFRDALERNDVDALFDSSASAELATLPAASAILLARTLSDAGDTTRAVQILETAQQANPSDLWVNLILAENLHKLARWNEMRHFAEIAHALRPASGAARLQIADALRHQGFLDQSAALCEQLIELEPQNPHAYHMLGSVREDQNEWAEAVTQFRKAIELHPAYVEAHNHLGRCLTRSGDLHQAIAVLRIAIKLKPDYGGAHENLGIALDRIGQVDEAIAELQQAIELDPQSAQPHTGLGVILVARGQVAAGIEEHRRAIKLNPDWAEAHLNLGNALASSGQIDSAVEEYRRALDLKPHLALPRWNLAQTLIDQGKFTDAQVLLREGTERNLRDRDGPYPFADRLKQCERMMELDGKLREVVAGIEPVANAAERAEYAAVCYSKRLFATAVRFYGIAFHDEPELADDLAHGYRYSAACSAVLASLRPSGTGGDAELSTPARESPESQTDEAESRRMRQLALGWLRDDLARHAEVLRGSNAKLRRRSIQQLQYWLVDRDLAGVRSPEALAQLTEDEQAAWSSFWNEVRRILEQ